MQIESLLWVLTVSQLEAAIVFLKFIKKSIQTAAGLEKSLASDKIKVIIGRSI